MTMPGEFAKNNLPDYGFARSLGLTSGNDFDFKALANQLDCSQILTMQVLFILTVASSGLLDRPEILLRKIKAPSPTLSLPESMLNLRHIMPPKH